MKNRHLLGFDSPAKALLTAVKEGVDNALDACEEAGVLPEIRVEIGVVRSGVYRVSVEDNGPGIVPDQIGRIFGKLLYGSKFHKLSQSRGQQGMGIAAAGMYAQLTTGKPARIVTRTGSRRRASQVLVSIDTNRNRPELHGKKTVDWRVPHGTRVELTMEAQHRSGAHSVEMYLKLTAIANPHVTLHYVDPDENVVTFERSSSRLPALPVEIKPHPHGVELGRLIAMLRNTEHKSLGKFLKEEFSRVGTKTASEIIERADRGLTTRSYSRRVAKKQAGALYRAIQKTKISAPTSDCVVPIGEELMLQGLRKEVEAELYLAVCRPPAVYRGNPFVVEVGLAYGRPGGGHELDDSGRIVKLQSPRAGVEDLLSHAGEPVTLLRFANRVPLLFQQGACVMTKAVVDTNWRSYGLNQPKGSLPQAAMVLMLHVASVWVPFTSESKEAVAAYPEIEREMSLALRECGRRLRTHVKKQQRLARELERRTHIERYLPHVGMALQEILDIDDVRRDALVERLDETLHHQRKV